MGRLSYLEDRTTGWCVLLVGINQSFGRARTAREERLGVDSRWVGFSIPPLLGFE
jgi:hypothetical protein